jgi:hypothetical protein
MAAQTPYAEIVGPAEVWVALYGTAKPAVNVTPGAGWLRLGATTGEQKIQHKGSNTYYRDDDHQGPTKADRPEEDVIAMFTLKDITHQRLATILHAASNIATSTSPAISRVPNKRGETLTEYALIVKGRAHSPFGNYPAMNYIPRGVFDGEPEETHGKGKRWELECEFHALEDDAQIPGYELGWGEAQTI